MIRLLAALAVAAWLVHIFTAGLPDHTVRDPGFRRDFYQTAP